MVYYVLGPGHVGGDEEDAGQALLGGEEDEEQLHGLGKRVDGK